MVVVWSRGKVLVKAEGRCLAKVGLVAIPIACVVVPVMARVTASLEKEDGTRECREYPLLGDRLLGVTESGVM